MNVLLYDETEDFYDTELKYPYSARRTVLGSYDVTYGTDQHDTQTVYYKKSEVCEATPDFSKRASVIEDKQSKGYEAAKTCSYAKLKLSNTVQTKSAPDNAQSPGKTIVEMNFILNPFISTLVISKDENQFTLVDLLVRVGGFLSFLWYVLLPFGKYISRKLYDANLVA